MLTLEEQSGCKTEPQVSSILGSRGAYFNPRIGDDEWGLARRTEGQGRDLLSRTRWKLGY